MFVAPFVLICAVFGAKGYVASKRLNRRFRTGVVSLTRLSKRLQRETDRYELRTKATPVAGLLLVR